MMIHIEDSRWKCFECGKFKAYFNPVSAREGAHAHIHGHKFQEPEEVKPCKKYPTKLQHNTIAEGKRHIARLYASGRGNPDYQVYKCDSCNKFHVGHSKVRLNKRIKQSIGSRR